MLGPLLLVSPVLSPRAQHTKTYLPSGTWRHVTTHQVIISKGMYVIVPTPIGKPGMFIRISPIMDPTSQETPRYDSKMELAMRQSLNSFESLFPLMKKTFPSNSTQSFLSKEYEGQDTRVAFWTRLQRWTYFKLGIPRKSEDLNPGINFALPLHSVIEVRPGKGPEMERFMKLAEDQIKSAPEH